MDSWSSDFADYMSDECVSCTKPNFFYHVVTIEIRYELLRKQ